MTKHVIFFHGGGGQQDYDADEKLAASLKLNLGATYLLHYPFLPEGDAPDLGRREQIDREISASEDGVILVGHSFGASMLLAYLSENKIKKKISGIFLISTPFWSGDEDWVAAFRLRPDLRKRYQEKFQYFFTIVVMMKKYRLITLRFTKKNFHGQPTAKYLSAAINITMT